MRRVEAGAQGQHKIQRGYLPVLGWTLNHSWVTLLIAVVVLGGTVALAPLMKTNFLGDSGQNTFTVTQELAPAASLDAEKRAGALPNQTR